LSNHFVKKWGPNWGPTCPVPLARGLPHLRFKQTLINCAHEIYVVAPLGKIFADAAFEQVNVALGFDEKYASAGRKPYQEVDINDTKACGVKLISTSRIVGRVLSNLNVRVCDRLAVQDGRAQRFVDAAAEDVPHILFPFDRLPNNWYLEKEV